MNAPSTGSCTCLLSMIPAAAASNDDDFNLPGLPGVTMPDLSGIIIPGLAPRHRSDSDGESDDDDDDDDDSDVEEVDEMQPGGAAFTVTGATKDDRKAHKAAVKEANREKRKAKVPKHVKKRKEKLRKAAR